MSDSPEDVAAAVHRWGWRRLAAAEDAARDLPPPDSIEAARAALVAAKLRADVAALQLANLHLRAVHQAKVEAARAALAASWEGRCAGYPSPVWLEHPTPPRRAAVVDVREGDVWIDAEYALGVSPGVTRYNARTGRAAPAIAGRIDVVRTVAAWREFCAARKAREVNCGRPVAGHEAHLCVLARGHDSYCKSAARVAIDEHRARSAPEVSGE